MTDLLPSEKTNAQIYLANLGRREVLLKIVLNGEGFRNVYRFRPLVKTT